MSLKFGKTIRTLRFGQNYLFLIKKVYFKENIQPIGNGDRSYLICRK